MSKKKPFKATSPIKHNGTKYEVGDVLNLTEDEADGLHVEAAPEAKAEQKKSKPNVSTAMNADPAIAMIEQTPYEELEGFVPEDEDRKTVLKAWEEKQAAQKEAEPESEDE